jgi:hypothetical protein
MVPKGVMGMLYEFVQQNKKIALALVAIAFLCIGSIVYFAITKTSGTSIDIYIVPQDATATIDGKPLRPGTQAIAAGSHEVIVRKYGFADYKETLTIDDTHKSIDVALSPVSADAQAWAQKNQALYNAKEARTSILINNAGEQFSKDNPIVNELPIDNLVYEIGYRRASSDPNDSSIIIEIDAMQGYRNGAVQKIKDLGYDPADFIINFRDYRNPFEL